MMKSKILLMAGIVTIFSCNTKTTTPPNTNLKITFFSNGNVESIKKYNDTTRVVQTIWFDENGNLKSIQKTIDTLHEGQNIWFYPNGNIQNTVIFKNGKATGNAFMFYQSGAIQNHRYWNNDKIIGYSTNYFDDSIGYIKEVLFYDKKGNLTNKKEAFSPGEQPH